MCHFPGEPAKPEAEHMLSGWLKLVAELDPARTINIHPGPLPDFGGPGMYDLCEYLGKAESLARIDRAIAKLKPVS